MRLIDADYLKEKGRYDDFDVFVVDYDDIKNAPTIDHVKHGRWIRELDMRGNISDVVWSCSVCGKPKQWYTTNFCPNCGAKMDGENDEID